MPPPPQRHRPGSRPEEARVARRSARALRGRTGDPPRVIERDEFRLQPPWAKVLHVSGTGLSRTIHLESARLSPAPRDHRDHAEHHASHSRRSSRLQRPPRSAPAETSAPASRSFLDPLVRHRSARFAAIANGASGSSGPAPLAAHLCALRPLGRPPSIRRFLRLGQENRPRPAPPTAPRARRPGRHLGQTRVQASNASPVRPAATPAICPPIPSAPSGSTVSRLKRRRFGLGMCGHRVAVPPECPAAIGGTRRPARLPALSAYLGSFWTPCSEGEAHSASSPAPLPAASGARDFPRALVCVSSSLCSRSNWSSLIVPAAIDAAIYDRPPRGAAAIVEQRLSPPRRRVMHIRGPSRRCSGASPYGSVLADGTS